MRPRLHGLPASVFLLGVLVLYFAVPVSTEEGPVQIAVRVVVSLAAIGLAGRVIWREIGRMDAGVGTLLGGLGLVLLLELVFVLFAITCYGLAVSRPGEFSGIETRLDALYFTAATMATVGYGDIHADGQVARGLVTVNLAFDVVFLGLLARLLTEAPRRRRGDS